MIFEYRAKKEDGTTVDGKIDAANEQVAIETLSDKGLIIISLTKQSKLPFWRRPLNISFLQGVKPKKMVFISRQLSVMVSAGLPLVQALKVLAEQSDKIFLKNILHKIADDVREGRRFSVALAQFPKVFDDFYINMVRAGETAGKLDEVLNYLADQKEKNYDLMSKIKSAMIYPAFVIAAVVGVMIIMMVFVIPQLTGVLQEAGVDLPLPTKILIAVSGFFSSNFILILLATILLIAGFIFWIKTPKGKAVWDDVLLKIPIFGDLFEEIYLVRFTRSLSTLIIGGIPISSALKIVAKVVGSSVYKETILDAVVDVEEGRSISSSFKDSPHIPSMLSQLLSVGERTGRLDDVLQKISDFYSREVQNTLSRLVTLLEPIIIIFLGVVVG
ncbi:MAG TPA: type II secretion system F family protein, partial [Patescibacteria group bacterium]|nr:type II secretion system F family protein [Patescibacteria group bacterium]